MKTLFTFLVILFCFSFESINAQAPQAIPYQAVAHDNVGNLISNQAVSLRFSIHDASAGGTVVYKETQSTTTNSFGLFSVNIGQGTVVLGAFAVIEWGINTKFMQVEIDMAGGTTYTDMGTQQLLSVPYALNAANGNFNKTGNDIYNSNSGNVGIGTTTPASSAQLEVTSATKGFLPPRMTSVQRNSITNPVAGLVVWCTNCWCNSNEISGELQVYNGITWTNIAGGVSCPGTVTVCNHTWMINNLDVSNYRNGDPIPKETDPTVWSNLTTGAWCWYNNDSATYAATYGKLYNWFAVNDPRGLAPLGWHIPADSEWNKLVKCLDPSSDTICSSCLQSLTAGGAIKETSKTHWSNPNIAATNNSGLPGLPGGLRFYVDGAFMGIGINCEWWSSTQESPTDASYRSIDNYNGGIFRGPANKNYGVSIRCLRD